MSLTPEQIKTIIDESKAAQERVQHLEQVLTANMARQQVDSYRVPKIPTFCRADPALWFMQVEISLRNARITSETTKADSMLAALDVEVLGSVKDIIAMSPPPPDIFEKLKERIIKTFAVSNEAKLRQLLKGQVLTDGKPSLILSRLRNLNVNNAVDDSILKSLFLEQLPEQHRGIVISNTATLDAMAELADQLADISSSSPCNPQINAVNAELSASQAQIQSLIECVKGLTVKVDAIERQSRSRSKSRSNSRSQDKSRDKEKPNLCYAHRKYPENPTSCRSWCTEYAGWKEKKN